MSASAPCARALVAAALLLASVPASGDVLSDVTGELGLTADERARLARGEVVARDPAASNERELSIGFAVRIARPPADLARDLLDGLALRENPDVLARGAIAKGTIDELAGVELASADAAQAYLKAQPGEALNLSTSEIATFSGLASAPGASTDPKAAVERALREQLLARARAYAGAGLAGIAPYDRGDRQERAGDDLLAATRASTFFAKHAPRMHAVLLGYPKGRPADLAEHTAWLAYDAHGQRISVLGHFMALQDGDAWSVASRHFYVSASYNAEQNLGLLVPTEDGGTLAIILTRVSTDQVAGFGGGAKRSIGRKLMAQTLTSLAETVRGAKAQ